MMLINWVQDTSSANQPGKADGSTKQEEKKVTLGYLINLRPKLAIRLA